MRTPITAALLLSAPLLFPSCASTAAAPAERAAAAAIGHDVFFQLQDPAQSAALIEACERLRAIPGVLHVTAGPRDETQLRDVNETWFHVALHVEFDSAEAYEGYGPHPVHQALLEQFGEGFARVAVYDSVIGPRAD